MDLRTFLSSRQPATEAEIEGISVGANASSLRDIEVDSVRGFRRGFEQARRGEDRFDAAVERLICDGGLAEVGDATFVVEDGIVRTIVLGGSWLEILGVSDEEELLALAGDVMTRTSRGIVIDCSIDPFAVDSILFQVPPSTAAEKGEFIFADGVRAFLVKVHMERIYAGLSEGLPVDKWNDKVIERLRHEADKSSLGSPLVVPPPRRPIPYPGKYPFGTPELLPSVGCYGFFRSLQTARDDSKDISWLTVVWFQKSLSPNAIQDIIGKIEWKPVATDAEW